MLKVGRGAKRSGPFFGGSAFVKMHAMHVPKKVILLASSRPRPMHRRK